MRPITFAFIAVFGQSADTSGTVPTKGEIAKVDKFINRQERINSSEYLSLNLMEDHDSRRYALESSDNKKKGILAVRYTLTIGNNWSEYIAIFSRPATKCLAYGRVGGKGYRSVEIKKVQGNIVKVSILYYSVSDALCCPSLPGSSIFAPLEGKLFENDVRINCGSTK